ncbi:MAG: hypothetical protein ACPG19_11490 [Saprospiraceae bacterium]
MENNNLDNFFNKKLNNFDSSGDDWDKLGKAPFENIQPTFPKYPKTTWVTPISILTGVMGVALTALVVYTFYLKNEIHTLQEYIITENITKETTDPNTSTNNPLLSKNENPSINTPSEETVDLPDNEIIQNNTSSIETNSNHRISNNNSTKIKESKRKRQAKKESILKKEKPSIKTKEQEIQEIITKSKEEKTTPNSTISLNRQNNKANQKDLVNQKTGKKNPSKSIISKLKNLDFRPLISKKLAIKPFAYAKITMLHPEQYITKPASKIKLGSFSLGYEYSFSNIIIPYDIELQDANSLPTKDNLNMIKNHSHGLILGYSWSPNWRISTGIRRAEAGSRFEINSNNIYNSANEYTLPNNSIANDLTFDKLSPLVNKTINFTLEFPINQRLNDGEVLSVEILARQEIEQTQIPLAIEYLFGKKKFQWFTQLGVQLNLMEIKTFDIDIMAQNFNQESLNVNNILDDDSHIKEQSIGLFGSVGANYQLFQHWSVRASLAYQHNFDDNYNKNNNPNQRQGKRDFLTEQTIRLGLNYQF